MKNTLRKALAVLLVFAMLFTFSSVSFADNSEPDDPETPTVVDKGELKTSGDFRYYKYTLNGSEIVEIEKYIGTSTDVTVPETIDGASVTIIGTEAFYMDPDIVGDAVTKLEIKNIVLPETVVTIGVRAFCNNGSLATITLPDSIERIESYAFYGCKNIAAVHMPESLEYIGDNAFYGCEKFVGNAYIQSEVENDDGSYADVPALRFPNTLKYIGDNAFTLCSSLVWVYIPDGITEICTGTFTNCYSLEYVVIPESVETIGAAFNGAYINHNRLSTYEPKLIIRNPHCKITASPNIDKHVVVYGMKYSAVNSFADSVKCQFKEMDTPGHNYVGVVTDPLCLEKGYTTYYCEICEEKGIEREDRYITDYVDALGHSYGEWYKGLKGEQLTDEELENYVDATCTTGAVQSRKCGDCGYIEVGRVPAKGHDFVTTTTATCLTDGRSKTTCKNCGLTQDYRFQAALGHDWDDGVVVSEFKQCESDGVIVRTCKRENCLDKDGHQTTMKEITPMHTDSNNDNECDFCSAAIAPTTCKCYCHATSGLKALFYKIQLIVWRLFGLYKVCDCGLAHY